MSFEKPSEKVETTENKAAKSQEQMADIVRKLELTSHFNRYKDDDGKEKLHGPEGEFSIRIVEDPKDPAVNKIYDFMVDEFGEDEAETKNWIKISIKKKLNWYHLIEGENKDIACLSSVQHLELEPEKGKEKEPKDSMLFVCFVDTRGNFRSKGYGQEICAEFYKSSLEEAKAKGHNMKGVIGEVVEKAERFWNKIGWSRMYYEDASGDLHEVPYMQPPVDIDDDGHAHSKQVPEHLMYQAIDGSKKMSVEEVLRSVRAIYKEYVSGEDNYNTHEGFLRSQKIMSELVDELKSSLANSKDGKVLLLTAKEREEKKKKLYKEGKEIHEIPPREEDVA